jgi:hypothetical protein
MIVVRDIPRAPLVRTLLAIRAPTLSAALLLASASLPAQAQGICVVCNGPDAVYRCQPEAGISLRPGDTRLNLLCITEIARADGHASCSVRRQQTGNCEGQLRTVAIASSPLTPPLASAPEPAPGQAPADAKGPPDTVAELAKRTAQSSKDQIDKATGAVGDAAKKTGTVVGDAAKKSWRCLTSLFSDC